MKIVVVGSGSLGVAVQEVLDRHGHELVTIGRTSGMLQADISDIASLMTVFARIGTCDAVANAAGDVFPAPLAQATDEQWPKSIEAKELGQRY